MSNLKQATLNEHCNGEAVEAYGERLRRWAQQERWAERDEIANGLDNAARLLEGAAQAVYAARYAAEKAAYDRLYRQRP